MEGTYIWAGKTYKLSDLAPQSSTTTGHELTCEDNGVHSGNRVETRVTDFVPRQLKRTLEYRGNSPKSNSVGGGNSGSSMDMVSVNIRDKLSRVST